ncbi:hypothetical protein BDZ97DRAFT_1915733 [Flammula alnicola]|nr:hypothetical protein BDZ97DRAFT_1915733 [Flammula alnicola]
MSTVGSITSAFRFPTHPFLNTMSPVTFTISYISFHISYPETEESKAKLPTDAVRVTRAQLSLMFNASYIHGGEVQFEADEELFESERQRHHSSMQDLQERAKDVFCRGFEQGRGFEVKQEQHQDHLAADASKVDFAVQVEPDLEPPALETRVDSERHIHTTWIHAYFEGFASWTSTRLSPELKTHAVVSPSSPSFITSDISIQILPISEEPSHSTALTTPVHSFDCAEDPYLSTSRSLLYVAT